MWNVCGCCACSTLKCSYRSEEEKLQSELSVAVSAAVSASVEHMYLPRYLQYRHIETENAVELVIVWPQYGLRLSACPVVAVVVVIYIFSE